MTDDPRTVAGLPSDRHPAGPPRWTWWALALFAAFLIVAGASTYAVVKVRAVARDAQHLGLANQATDAKIRRETRSRAAEIEESRVDVIERSCGEQNRRHDDVIAKLDRLTSELPPGARRDRAKRNRAGTVLLLEALAPHRDCAKRAQRLIRP